MEGANPSPATHPTKPVEKKAGAMPWSLEEIEDEADDAPGKDQPPIPINADAFPAAFAQLKADLGAGRPSLQGIFQSLEPKLDGHAVIARVGTPTMEGQLNQYRDAIVDALRRLLQNPTVIFRIELDESLVPEVQTERMSIEQKHQQMLAINPALAALEKVFKTTTDV